MFVGEIEQREVRWWGDFFLEGQSVIERCHQVEGDCGSPYVYSNPPTPLGIDASRTRWATGAPHRHRNGLGVPALGPTITDENSWDRLALW